MSQADERAFDLCQSLGHAEVLARIEGVGCGLEMRRDLGAEGDLEIGDAGQLLLQIDFALLDLDLGEADERATDKGVERSIHQHGDTLRPRDLE